VLAWLDSTSHLFLGVGCRIAGLLGGPVGRQPRLAGLLGGHLFNGLVDLVGHPRVAFWAFPPNYLAGGSFLGGLEAFFGYLIPRCPIVT
jgi:hypothetical protein